MSFQNKNKFALWLYPKTKQLVEQHYRSDNCKSQSEYDMTDYHSLVCAACVCCGMKGDSIKHALLRAAER